MASDSAREVPYPAFDKLCTRCLEFTRADYVEVEDCYGEHCYFFIDNRPNQSPAETTFRARWTRNRILPSVLGAIAAYPNERPPKADERIWIHDNREQILGRAARRECHFCFVLAGSIGDCTSEQSSAPFVGPSRMSDKQTVVVLVAERRLGRMHLVVWMSDPDDQDYQSRHKIEFQPIGQPSWYHGDGLPLSRNSKFDPNGPRSSVMLLSTLKFLKSSLATCINDHKECLKQRECATGAWPSRLIHVDGSPNDIRLKLVEVANLDSDQWLLGYVTLSHCWGSQGIVSKLTRANYAASMENIPTKPLSKTFREAAMVTLALGQRYLWIDALCIIQDSREDWLHESPLMGHIYASGLINLAATASEDGQGGLLVQDYLKSTCTIRIQHGKLKGVYDVSPVTCSEGSGLLDRPETRGMDQSPLQRRAWVFQETVLSTRIAYFTNRQVNYQCYESFLRETHTNQILFSGWRDDDYSAVRNHFDRNNWEELVNLYVKCELSLATDRLPAFAGIAQAYAEKNRYPPHDYLAGLWRWQIWHHLLWKLCSRNARLVPSKNEDNSFVAPTWSWASVYWTRALANRDHLYQHKDSRDYIYNPTLELVDTEIVPEGNSYFGALRKARLRIKTVLIRTQWPPFDKGDMYMRILDSLGRWYDLRADWDRTSVSPHQHEVYVLPLRHSNLVQKEREKACINFSADFLAVMPVKEQPGAFCRCGSMEIHMRDWPGRDLPDWWIVGSELDEALYVEHQGLGQYVIDLI